MIGSHDSFTFIKSTSMLYEHYSRMWRTQCRSIRQQYNFGVRFFDIRVRETSRGEWQLCHGIVDLPYYFGSLYEICQIMQSNYSMALYRIVLERGNKENEHHFALEAWNCVHRYHHFWRADIKSHKNWMGEVANNNDLLYAKGYKFATVNTWEAPLAHELHGSLTAKNFFKIDLRKEATKYNRDILNNTAINLDLKPLIDDREHLYFIDYSTFQYR